VRTAKTVYVPDLATEQRWPDHIRELLRTTPVRCILALSLGIDDTPLGALTLYASHPNAFTKPLYAVACVYAEHAAVALDSARNGHHAGNLAAAVESNREIGIALGILVERHKITPDQAFDMLRIASQRTHTKLRDLASDLVRTGSLATP